MSEKVIIINRICLAVRVSPRIVGAIRINVDHYTNYVMMLIVCSSVESVNRVFGSSGVDALNKEDRLLLFSIRPS